MVVRQRSRPCNWLWTSTNILALLPVLWAARLFAMAPYSSNTLVFATGESQRLILFTGKTALIFLVLSLACTPAARLLGWRRALTIRKPLGLWGFGYALVHGLLFLGGKAIFYSIDAWRGLVNWYPSIFIPTQLKTPYAAYGALAICLLFPLALTSNRWAMRWLGRGWKRLHRLVYLAVPLAIFHYWRRETYLPTIDSLERADYRQPLFFALVVGLFLLARIPVVRRRFARMLSQFKEKQPC